MFWKTLEGRFKFKAWVPLVILISSIKTLAVIPMAAKSALYNAYILSIVKTEETVLNGLKALSNANRENQLRSSFLASKGTRRHK